MHIIDRRLNPKEKSLGNRQRFIRRARDEIRNAVNEALKKRKISEVESGEKIRIRAKSLQEPSFHIGRDGSRDFVLPGNKEYVVGDTIPKPPEGGGGGGVARLARTATARTISSSPSRKDEFLDLFFEDLKLPNLVKTKLKDVRSPTPVRAGYHDRRLAGQAQPRPHHAQQPRAAHRAAAAEPGGDRARPRRSSRRPRRRPTPGRGAASSCCASASPA